ncbi:MAG: phosphatase PAP2 family protein [Candidatus Sericytochromatia bacterium]|nr:phosphatase PAP2 family protein [Candidatus Sericytochromatia bacterium]
MPFLSRSSPSRTSLAVAAALLALPPGTQALRASHHVAPADIALLDAPALAPTSLTGVPVAPPPAAASWQLQQELWTVSQARATLTRVQAQAVARWTRRPTVVPWNEHLRDRLGFHRHKFYLPRNARGYALLNVAMYDAMLTAGRAQAHYGRAEPARVAFGVLGPLVPARGVASYPSVEAAAAWAAARVLAHLLPEEAKAAEAMAEEACRARVWAGLAYPSDVAAARPIGEGIADGVLRWRRSDGAEAYSGVPALSHLSAPTAAHGGLWRHPVPTEPRAGSWDPWLLTSPSQFRLPPPPRPGDTAFEHDHAEVLALSHQLSAPQQRAAEAFAPIAPTSAWVRLVIADIERSGLGELAAARVMAYWARAQADAAIACWDSKYWWMQIRPHQEESRRRPGTPWWPYGVTTPAHPSYPAGHSVASAASAAFLDRAFPTHQASHAALLREMSLAGLWGGIHYRTDMTAGQALGARVGRLHVEAMEQDAPPPPPRGSTSPQ